MALPPLRTVHAVCQCCIYRNPCSACALMHDRPIGMQFIIASRSVPQLLILHQQEGSCCKPCWLAIRIRCSTTSPQHRIGKAVASLPRRAGSWPCCETLQWLPMLAPCPTATVWFAVVPVRRTTAAGRRILFGALLAALLAALAAAATTPQSSRALHDHCGGKASSVRWQPRSKEPAQLQQRNCHSIPEHHTVIAARKRLCWRPRPHEHVAQPLRN